ncbi:adenosine deaminase [Candidatus Parcubacteria bacterium]|nr:adenosine deaminase [Candidatus Parcubacteria bacterium]
MGNIEKTTAKNEFIEALKSNTLAQVISVPKSDLHNHYPLGSDISFINKWYKKDIPKAPSEYSSLENMLKYIHPIIKPIASSREGFEYLLKASLLTALSDGITLLEMSLDCWFIDRYDGNPTNFVNKLKEIHISVAPTIDFRPAVGLNRDIDIKELEAWAFPLIESGYFKSIDLYGTEGAKKPEVFKKIYTKAKDRGMKLKAHIGEFSDAKSIQETVEILNLSEVQHGISAVRSKAVMNWLKKNNIRLNVCPTSNIKLGRVKNIKTHPIRTLFDHGIKVTINSDDILAFNQTVSMEYLDLYRSGLFSAKELNIIRLEGLQ